MDGPSIYTFMEKKNPVGRPRKLKTLVIEQLIVYWLATGLSGLVWLFYGGEDPARAMLAVSGLLWWMGSLVDLWWP